MTVEVRCLEEVAKIYDDRCVAVRGAQRLLRKGPYPLYVETGTIPFDDYAFDGTFLVLGAACNVESPYGYLQVTCTEGKFSATDLYHVIACEDDADTRYLHYVLARIPAHLHADMSGQTVRLSQNSLSRMRVPWPSRAMRRAFVRFMDAMTKLHDECVVRKRELLDQGAFLYSQEADSSKRAVSLEDICKIRRGEFLKVEKRVASGRFPVVSSQGVVGYTNEDGIAGACLVVGQAGQYVLGYRMGQGAYPLQDTIALEVRKGAPMGYESLVVALAARGVRPRLRVVNRAVDALAATLDELAKLEIALPSDNRVEALQLAAEDILDSIDKQEERSVCAQASIAKVSEGLLACDENALGELASWMHPEDAKENGVPKRAHRGACSDEKPPSCSADAAHSLLADLVHEVRSSLSHTQGSAASLFDAVWEVMPLLFLRAQGDFDRWKNMAQSGESREAADAWLLELADSDSNLALVRELTSRSSLLGNEMYGRLIRILDELPDSSCTGSLIRWIAMEYQVETVTRGQLSTERRIDAPCPEVVSSLIGRLSAVFAPDAASVFDPCSKDGGVIAQLRQQGVVKSCCGQARNVSEALAAALAASCEGWSFEEGSLLVGDALCEDRFEGLFSDLVVSVFPPNQGEWTDIAPDSRDARWVFGLPPRNKANLAWLQHAFAHRAEQGFVVVAMSNAVLHEARGCEPAVRSSLIDSGCIRAVVSLPGCIFDDGRAPMSLLVLGDFRTGATCETLFVNALECSIERVDEVDCEGRTMRTVSREEQDRIVLLVKEWTREETCAPVPGYAASVSKRTIADCGELVPWIYV